MPGPEPLRPTASPDRHGAAAPSAAPLPASAPAAQPDSLAAIVERARIQNCSDVHLGVGEEPRFRSRGDMVGTGWPVTTDVQFDRWVGEMLDAEARQRFRHEKEFDGSYAFDRVRVRINLLESLRGPAMVLRLIPGTIASLEELQLPTVLQELAGRPKGLVLVTGPTGSGKSTTLYALLSERNDPGINISTVEDPIEYTLQGITQTQVNRDKGLDFSTALRAFMRQDPDVLLVGETRDIETAKTATEAALTGHLVLTTLHCNDAASAIARLEIGRAHV